jgi:hypothetical protein
VDPLEALQDGITYGLAEVGCDALKVGPMTKAGRGSDSLKTPSSGELEALRARLDRILTVPVRELLGGERCLYTMTATEDFLIDTWPGDPRVAFASACSGHGFKFAPLTGRILAELIVNGQADLPGGLAAAALFALRRPPAPAPAVSSEGWPGPSLASSPFDELPLPDRRLDATCRADRSRPRGCSPSWAPALSGTRPGGCSARPHRSDKGTTPTSTPQRRRAAQRGRRGGVRRDRPARAAAFLAGGSGQEEPGGSWV